MDDEPVPTWHQALAYAVTGRRCPELGSQRDPDLNVLAGVLGGVARGVHPVPPDLLRGIGPAQFAAVLGQLTTRLAASTSRPVLADRAPDADERRLLAEVPPHH